MAAVKVPADVELAGPARLRPDRASNSRSSPPPRSAPTAASSLLAPLLPAPLAIAVMALRRSRRGSARARPPRRPRRRPARARARPLPARTRNGSCSHPEGLPARLPGRAAAAEDGAARHPGPAGARKRAGRARRRQPTAVCSARAAPASSCAAADEQAAFVAAFARFLNGLTEPIQIDVRSERVTARTRRPNRSSTPPRRSDGRLGQAALEHAALPARAQRQPQPLHRRRILLVLRSRDRRPELAEVTLARRADEATELLQGAAVALTPLDGEQAAALARQHASTRPARHTAPTCKE